MSRFHHRSKSSVLLAALILLMVIGVINMGYDSDLSDDHPVPVYSFEYPIYLDNTYIQITLLKFVEKSIILHSENKHRIFNKAPPISSQFNPKLK